MIPYWHPSKHLHSDPLRPTNSRLEPYSGPFKGPKQAPRGIPTKSRLWLLLWPRRSERTSWPPDGASLTTKLSPRQGLSCCGCSGLLSIYIYIYIIFGMCIHLCMYVCLSACLPACMCLCIYACMCVCLYICMYIPFWGHIEYNIWPQSYEILWLNRSKG